MPNPLDAVTLVEGGAALLALTLEELIKLPLEQRQRAAQRLLADADQTTADIEELVRAVDAREAGWEVLKPQPPPLVVPGGPPAAEAAPSGGGTPGPAATPSATTQPIRPAAEPAPAAAPSGATPSLPGVSPPPGTTTPGTGTGGGG